VRRLAVEVEWRKREEINPGQPPLDPCCMQIRKNGFHDENRCTRLRRKTLNLSKEDIDRAWLELIESLPDPEHGEDA
jgi:hypothetical protein